MSKMSGRAVHQFPGDFAGTEGLDDWKRAPETPAKALNWYRIHGKFSLFVAINIVDTFSIKDHLPFCLGSLL